MGRLLSIHHIRVCVVAYALLGLAQLPCHLKTVRRTKAKNRWWVREGKPEGETFFR
jgi:hypothetical protein